MSETKKFYGLQNDYMFHVAMQDCLGGLKRLSALAMEIEPESIKDFRVENPIEPGKRVGSKTCILDIKARVNEKIKMNLEMQVKRYKAWDKRTLLYWCRTYDDLDQGEDYKALEKTYQIGILSYPLFPEREEKEFLSEYQIRNRKTGELYTDMLSIRILDLTQIQAEYERNPESELVQWARLFLIESMEELNAFECMNAEMEEVVLSLKKLNEEERIRLECEAREWYEMDMKAQYSVGREEGREELIYELVRDGLISLSDGARKLSITDEQLRCAIREEGTL